MNKQDRSVLEKAIHHLNEAKSLVEEIKYSEESKFDNLPDGLKESEKGMRLETGIEMLEEAIDNISSSEACVDMAISN